ncbi:sensor histidine kinase [Spirosoma foliorum]|uniref:histidine kinase n=1 Tax=Spirosoma foliorum TaxID=2710596 RepID=A0A7G5GQ77_9BACT|nr:PAS domain-containing sensor histidine kinase [Spirosoma foliorum]QMW01019.1 PAS domain S-box protein [Spirosoma foliorum]
MHREPYASGLLNVLFEQGVDFLGVYDFQKDCYVRINQIGVKMLGYPSEQLLIDQPQFSFRKKQLTPEQRAQAITQILQQGYYEEETEIARYTGETFWGRLIVEPFADGQLALIRITNLDRLHRAEQELDHSVRRYEAVFTNATIGIIVCDQQGKIVSANQVAGQLFGYGVNQLIELPIDQLVPQSISQYHQKLRQSFIDHPQARPMGHNRDLYAQRKDGSLFPVEVSLSYFRLDNTMYAVAYIIDITLKKGVEKQVLDQKDQLERLNAELEQKVINRTHALMNTLRQLETSKEELAQSLKAERELGELKSRFVSMASHEFRTPLTAILNSTTLIEKYPDTDQQPKRQNHLHRIRMSVKHLNEILEEFLSVGKLEEGKVIANPTLVDLSQLVDEVIGDMQSLLKAGQMIATDIHCPYLIWLDPSLLRKIIVNLLSNAIKYSGEESIIRILATTDEQRIMLIIKDQGIGISIDDQQHLFEQFFRAKNAANIAGTGLGLHIVAKYVELMRGTITLQSELNKGTTVTITFPYENHPLD